MTNAANYLRQLIIADMREMVRREGKPVSYCAVIGELIPKYMRHVPSVRELSQWVRLDTEDLCSVRVGREHVACVCFKSMRGVEDVQ